MTVTGPKHTGGCAPFTGLRPDLAYRLWLPQTQCNLGDSRTAMYQVLHGCGLDLREGGVTAAALATQTGNDGFPDYAEKSSAGKAEP